LRTERPRKTKIGTEVGHVTRLGHHFQGQKVKSQGHQAASVACSSHYLTYMDDNAAYATVQSERLPVDLGAGRIVVAARIQLVQFQPQLSG